MYCIYDKITGQFLKADESWSHCYHEGTQLLKIGDDIPLLLSRKVEADRCVKSLEKDFRSMGVPENEIDFRAIKCKRTECVVIEEWSKL